MPRANDAFKFDAKTCWPQSLSSARQSWIDIIISAELSLCASGTICAYLYWLLQTWLVSVSIALSRSARPFCDFASVAVNILRGVDGEVVGAVALRITRIDRRSIKRAFDPVGYLRRSEVWKERHEGLQRMQRGRGCGCAVRGLQIGTFRNLASERRHRVGHHAGGHRVDRRQPTILHVVGVPVATPGGHGLRALVIDVIRAHQAQGRVLDASVLIVPLSECRVTDVAQMFEDLRVPVASNMLTMARASSSMPQAMYSERVANAKLYWFAGYLGRPWPSSACRTR